ncbi:hypothetical protein CYLTODRAFT_459444 [Cylindrobasidium torrendii FP15055 ss-10]|uniref:Uncharacterized protein n=1 Tax=Cylindrobasidium torrendii FP15055 ss-10 TaxID=1314674 RepID=A0A0D7AVP2_9AGAR|nr:hypothetical protein CYLTODRAFT_459444 [Cylindrobasidium torrendii FP15055 ss-10]
MSFERQQAILASPNSNIPPLGSVEGQQVLNMPNSATITAFIDSLKPSLLPSRCSRFFWGMFICFLPGPSRKVIEQLRRSNPEIFTAALKFIATPRTREELVALGSSMLVCDCPLDAAYWVHALVDKRPTTATEAAEQFFDSLCGIVRDGLGVQKRYTGTFSDWPTLDSLVRASEKSLKRTGSAIWPSKHSDVFLGKHEEVVSMVWRIFDTFPATQEPLRLFFVLWKLSPSTVSRAATLIDGSRWPAQLLSNANRTFDDSITKTRRFLKWPYNVM